jgi:hypothetical protein
MKRLRLRWLALLAVMLLVVAACGGDDDDDGGDDVSTTQSSDDGTDTTMADTTMADTTMAGTSTTGGDAHGGAGPVVARLGGADVDAADVLDNATTGGDHEQHHGEQRQPSQSETLPRRSFRTVVPSGQRPESLCRGGPGRPGRQ